MAEELNKGLDLCGEIKAKILLLGGIHLDFSLISVLYVFLVSISISSVFNILFKMTKKKDWLLTFLISVGLAIVIVALLGGEYQR